MKLHERVSKVGLLGFCHRGDSARKKGPRGEPQASYERKVEKNSMYGDEPAPTRERTKGALAHHKEGIIVMGKHVKRYGEGRGGGGANVWVYIHI